MFSSVDHESNLWDKKLTAHLSVFTYTWPLRFSDVLKIKNTIPKHYFLHTAAVCTERGCVVNSSCMLSNCLVISIFSQLTIFKALFHCFYRASKSSTPAWSCQVETFFIFYFFFQRTRVQQSYLGLSLLPAFISLPEMESKRKQLLGHRDKRE